jgi:GT2 family glycosyltransferase
MKTIAAVLACHNRRDKTLACLRALSDQTLPPDCQLRLFLLDDGSSDGTGEAVSGEFPRAVVLRGDGNRFWCGGMRLAWQAAAATRPDAFLLANDDTIPDAGALAALCAIAPEAATQAIAVAAIRDPNDGSPTYGGIRRESGLVAPTGRVERCDTFNANLVLVPRCVWEKLGIFHHEYTHGMADFDYGFQATRQGVPVLQSPIFLGVCGRNPVAGTWRDTNLGRVERLRKLQSPKGLPFREWCAYNRRNSGWKWPYYCISPWVRILFGK